MINTSELILYFYLIVYNKIYIRVVHFDIILSKVEGRKLTYFLKSRISKVEVFRYFKKAESRRSKVFDIMKSSKIEVEVF